LFVSVEAAASLMHVVYVSVQAFSSEVEQVLAVQAVCDAATPRDPTTTATTSEADTNILIRLFTFSSDSIGMKSADTAHQLQPPPLHVLRHGAPPAQDCLHAPPSHVKLQTAPAAHACEQLPPVQVKLH
jgi:hypothetical protein